MAKFFSLSSSSKGNSYYLSSGSTSVLIDAGISCRQVEEQLAKHDVDPKELSAILITHEHSDHIRGLKVLTKKYNIPVYSASETLSHLINGDFLPANATVNAVSSTFCLGDMQVKPFDTPHDSVHSIGFRLELSSGASVGFATDLGTITPTVRENLEGCELVLIESNFDQRMLECSDYPYPLKRRIKGNFGHLANDDCASEIAHLVRTGSTRFILGHLSEQNNMPVIAYETTKTTLESFDIIEGKDYLMSIAPARVAGNMVLL